MFKTLAIAGAVSLLSAAAQAAVIDIDFETGYAGDETVVGDPFSTGGVTFTRGEEQTVVKTGSPTDGFVPNDTITGGLFGDFFLSDDFRNNTSVSLTLDFDAPYVQNLSFYIGDIDGTADQTETFSATAFLLGGGTHVVSFTSGQAGTGNSIATLFDFTGYDVTSVAISGFTPGQQRNIGWGIDNISATPVPLPAGVVLMMTAFGGLVAARRRRR